MGNGKFHSIITATAIDGMAASDASTTPTTSGRSVGDRSRSPITSILVGSGSPSKLHIHFVADFSSVPIAGVRGGPTCPQVSSAAPDPFDGQLMRRGLEIDDFVLPSGRHGIAHCANKDLG